METELVMNEVETSKGTVVFNHVNGDWDFDGMIGFQAELNGQTVMTVLVDVNDAEVGLFDFFAFKPGQDWNEMHHLGEEQSDAMAALKKEIEETEETKEKIYGEEDLMMETATVSFEEFDAGHIDDPVNECDSDWATPTGTLDQVKAWFKQHAMCTLSTHAISYDTLYEIGEDGYVGDPIIEARPIFVVEDENCNEVGRFDRYDEANSKVSELWDEKETDAEISLEIKFIEY